MTHEHSPLLVIQKCLESQLFIFICTKLVGKGGIMDTLYFQGQLYSDFAEYLLFQVDINFYLNSIGPTLYRTVFFFYNTKIHIM